MLDTVNQKIYNENYSAENVRLDLQAAPKYTRRLSELRFSWLHQYAEQADVLDVGCGAGDYLIPILDQVRSAVGLDFSSTMLQGFRENLETLPKHLQLLEADAREIPLDDQSIDFAFSYTALYHIPEVEKAIQEINRVLRPGGHAVLEFGNLHSINTIICNYNHKHWGWAKPYHISYRQMLGLLRENHLQIIDRRSLQLFNNYGAPRRLCYLYPLASPYWRTLLGWKIGGFLADEWLSGCWPLRHFAFRHFFVVRKP